MEYDPHQLIEGMILSAYCIGADVSYIFIRGEYVVAIERLREGPFPQALNGDHIFTANKDV